MGYDYMCDLWSVGIIAYVLLCGRLPIDADSTGDEKSRMKELSEKIAEFKPETASCFTDKCFCELDELPQDFIKSLLTTRENRSDASKAL